MTRPSLAWSVLPPLGFAGALLVIGIGDWNVPLFHQLNGWSAYTGPEVWGGITVFGDTLVVLALCLPVVLHRPQWAVGFLLAALLTTAVTHSFKPWLDLPRPARVLGSDAITVIGPVLKRRAMPSGHASAIMAAAGALVPMMRGPWLRPLAFGFALLVAVSRVVVGAHWPMDVAAGALIGWLAGVAAMRLASAPALADKQRVAAAFLALVLAGCVLYLPFFRTGYPGAIPVQLGVAAIAVGVAGAAAVDKGGRGRTRAEEGGIERRIT